MCKSPRGNAQPAPEIRNSAVLSPSVRVTAISRFSGLMAMTRQVSKGLGACQNTWKPGDSAILEGVEEVIEVLCRVVFNGLTVLPEPALPVVQPYLLCFCITRIVLAVLVVTQGTLVC